MNNSTKILRELAREYFELASLDINGERKELHRSVIDLDMKRPVVLIHELPWNELNVDGSLTLECEDDLFRKYELDLRRKIFQFKHFPADMILNPYIGVNKIINSTGIGIGIEEDTISMDVESDVMAHEYHDQLKTWDDLKKLKMPTLTYDKQGTMDIYNKLGEAVGDILPIKLKGMDGFSYGTWDGISTYRGVTPLLMDLVDRPEFTHKMVRILTDIAITRLEQLEALGAFDNDVDTIHCTPATNSTLKPYDENGNTTRKNIWGRGAAQIFASVSKEMRDEFDIQYMKETIGQCGLSYYGCCEPLDTMIDVVEKLPNLRKISITPWANPVRAAEAIGGKYVFSSKPNPAYVGVDHLNEDVLRDEISTILKTCKTNNCNVDIVLKDISTVNYNIDNVTKWEEIVMQMVNEW